MRPRIISLGCLALAAASPALAQPVVIVGAAPDHPQRAAPAQCVVEPAGAASARIRCRTPPAADHGPASEIAFLVSAQTASPPARCSGAEVVRLPGSPSRVEAARPTVVEGAPAPICRG